MSQPVIKIELVRRAIQEVYQSPLAEKSYADLSATIRTWEEDSPENDEDEEKRIYDGLQSLTGFLQNKGYESEADEVVSFTLKFFPERYFPELPRTRAYKDLDLLLFKSARQALKNIPDSEEKLAILNLFEEHYREAIQDLELLASEIAEGKFKKNGTGTAGELFRCFADAALQLQNTPVKDNIWTLMNQLAMKINISINGYNQAFLLLNGIEKVNAEKPSGWLREEMIRNEIFFWRNYCWKNIDEAVVAKDNSQIVYWIDNSLPFMKTGYERTNLLSLRAGTAMNTKPFPRQFLTGGTIFIVIAAIVFIISREPEAKKSLNLEQSREELIQSIRTGFQTEEKKPQTWQQIVSQASKINSKTGLPEVRPPLKPHLRPLNLLEVRHAIFQKFRLDYLKEQYLSKEESMKLAALENDWKSRCDFYEYNIEDREKVHWDLKIYGPYLTQDAIDILNSWRGRDKNGINAISPDELMSQNNPLHIRLIIQELRHRGCFKASETPQIWNEECSWSLKEFKATYLSIVDSVWDIKTQKALFGM